MFVVLVAAIIALVFAFLGWHLDCRERDSIGRLLTTGVMGTAVWLLLIIVGARWFNFPGSYGPVQIWSAGRNGGLNFFHIRELALFLVFLGFPAALAFTLAAVSELRHADNPRWRRFVVPITSFILYRLACWLFFVFEFFPTV